MAWQRISVPLVGRDEPVIAQPNALDWRSVKFDLDAPLDGLWQAAHRYLVRTGEDVPPDYLGFLARLDGMPEALSDNGDGLAPLDPTNAAPLDGSP